MEKKLFKHYIPTQKQIRESTLLSCLGDYIHQSNLWHFNRHSVSKAFAIGLFCMWLPFPMQSLLAAGVAIFTCANLPLSVALVFVTNPITIPPMFYFAYWLGTVLLQTPTMPFDFQVTAEWLSQMIGHIWQPLVVGCLILAVLSGILGYLSIQLLWRINILRRWKGRRCLRRRLKKKK